MLLISDGSFFIPKSCKSNIIYLAFFWVLGSMVGVWLSRIIYNTYFPLMLAYNKIGVSIVTMVFVKTFPLVILVFVSLYITDRWIPLFAFIRSALFSFCSGIIYCVYCSSGWLLSFLLLFSGIWINVILLQYWIYILFHKQRSFRKAAYCILAILCVQLAERFLVYPLLSVLDI